MKRTFKGKVVAKMGSYVRDIHALVVADGMGESYPLDWLFWQMNEQRDKHIRVSIEVEPVSLRDRVAKIFEEMIARRGAGSVSNPPEEVCYALEAARAEVLAEIDKEEQAK